MARPVYSTPFLVHAGLSGTGQSLTVPVGHTYIIKFLSTYASPIIGSTVVFLEHEPTGAALWQTGVVLGDAPYHSEDVTIAFLEGEGFHFQVNADAGNAADVYAGGYDLLNAG